MSSNRAKKYSVHKLAVCVIFGGVVSIAQAGWLDQAQDLLQSSSSESSESSTADQSAHSSSALPANLSTSELSKAFKQALDIGSKQVVSQLSQVGGYSQDPAVHIPLPTQLQRADALLKQAGLGDYSQALEAKLNEAAEQAAPQAQALFIQAISEMKFADLQALYNGPDDSATQYLRQKTDTELQRQMKPIIAQKMDEVGAVKLYDQMMAEYQGMPFVPDIKTNLVDYTSQKGLDGLFYYLAEKEAEIRENPAEQTTELLKKVFSP
ncbi:hypothetical protein AVO42_10415 [Thiomicrospira sp. XS5]|uniref:DUF4197 domain-containing protein n=1 Tax=Thiomicrospira sp. XS5 TaxID=1775636 RepID=UPI000746B94F|nr:DUF4197 domain-containing protein [Thiomicrospira sp. XS5]KUJ75700.1 hypothetical protein AVO42_10415 [Thiomicrospira sp. XS5]